MEDSCFGAIRTGCGGHAIAIWLLAAGPLAAAF